MEHCKCCDTELTAEYEEGEDFCQACLDDVPSYRLNECENL